jgi:hypothetical protein
MGKMEEELEIFNAVHCPDLPDFENVVRSKECEKCEHFKGRILDGTIRKVRCDYW